MPLFVTLLTGVVGVSGCKDSPTEPAQPLNEEEAKALFSGLVDLLPDSTAVPISVTAGGAAQVFACPRGGEVEVALSVNEELVGGTFRTNVELSLDPESCVIPSEGYQFTTDGNPGVRFETRFSTVGQTESFRIDMAFSGGLDWQLDERSGTCMIDLSGSLELGPSNIEEIEGNMSGTMCGLEVEFESPQPPV